MFALPVVLILVFLVLGLAMWHYWHTLAPRWGHLTTARWIPAPLSQQGHITQPIVLPMKPSQHFRSGGQSHPVFMLVRLPLRSQNGDTIYLDADADTGSSALAVVTSNCKSCYCVDQQCNKMPADWPGQVSKQVYGMGYEQGVYPVRYWQAQAAGLDMYVAGIVGVARGAKQVQSIVGLRPSSSGAGRADSFIDTVYHSLSPSLPRSLVFDCRRGELVLGQRRSGLRVALLPDSEVRSAQGSKVSWYVVQLVAPVKVDDKELTNSPTMAILDTGTSLTSGHSSLRKRVAALAGEQSQLHVPLADNLVVTVPMPAGRGRCPLLMDVGVKPCFVMLGLNAFTDKCVSFDWDQQAVYFQ